MLAKSPEIAAKLAGRLPAKYSSTIISKPQDVLPTLTQLLPRQRESPHVGLRGGILFPLRPVLFLGGGFDQAAIDQVSLDLQARTGLRVEEEKVEVGVNGTQTWSEQVHILQAPRMIVRDKGVEGMIEWVLGQLNKLERTDLTVKNNSINTS